MEDVVHREDKLCDLHFLKVTLSMQHRVVLSLGPIDEEASLLKIVRYLGSESMYDFVRNNCQHLAMALLTSNPIPFNPRRTPFEAILSLFLSKTFIKSSNMVWISCLLSEPLDVPQRN